MFKYRMEGYEYALVDEHNKIHWAGEEIAVAFSFDPSDERDIQGTLHKHGSPDRVNSWADETRKKYVKAGYHDMANEITVVSGRIDLDELNKMIDISGYIGIWYKKLLETSKEEVK